MEKMIPKGWNPADGFHLTTKVLNNFVKDFSFSVHINKDRSYDYHWRFQIFGSTISFSSPLFYWFHSLFLSIEWSGEDIQPHQRWSQDNTPFGCFRFAKWPKKIVSDVQSKVTVLLEWIAYFPISTNKESMTESRRYEAWRLTVVFLLYIIVLMLLFGWVLECVSFFLTVTYHRW